MEAERRSVNYVPVDECVLKMNHLQESVSTICGSIDSLKLSLYDANGRGGLIKDISDIKADIKIIKSWTGFVKPILISVFSSGIMATIIYYALR